MVAKEMAKLFPNSARNKTSWQNPMDNYNILLESSIGFLIALIAIPNINNSCSTSVMPYIAIVIPLERSFSY